eukprot:Sdes_comp20966_c0_seq4m18898
MKAFGFTNQSFFLPRKNSRHLCKKLYHQQSSGEELCKLSLVKAIQGIQTKKFTCKQVTSSCLQQLKATNQLTNCYITITEKEALERAENWDRQKKLNHAENPPSFTSLSGIPIAVKDNYNTLGILTTAASKMLSPTNSYAGFVPPFESTLTQRLFHQQGPF